MTARRGRRARGAHAAERQPGPGRLRTLVALLLLVPTVAVQAATTTSADAAVVAGFEIDGDTPVNAGGVDWGTPVGTFVPDPTGNADTSNFGQGAKEFANPSTWQQQTGVAPNQDDISGVYFHSDAVADDVWGFVGVRRLTTTGVTNFDVEFNARPNAGSTFAPTRTPGDVMVRFEQDGNNTFELSEGYFWRLVSDSAWDADCVTVPGYTPAAGWCKEPSVTSIPFTGATGESGHFAEGAFNFSSLLDVGGIGDATCEGGNFGTMNIRTFTGNADESALKDYVDAVAIAIDDSCGELEIAKQDQFGASVPGATFEISPNPIPGQSASPLVVQDGGTPGVDTAADGMITIDPATPGTYTVVETVAPAGHELVQPASARTWTLVVTDDATSWQTGSPGTGPVQTGPFVVENRKYFKPLGIANVASGSYGVEYDWLVHKTVVGASSKTVEEGQTTTFDYEVELEALPEGPPAGKEVHGTVTVTNPNPTAYPVVRATISIDGDLPCHFLPTNGDVDVDPGTAGVQVDVGAGVTPYDYSCDPGAGALVSGDTTATVSWDQGTYPQAAAHPGSADATATYDITVQPKIDERASVTDAFDGGPATPIGAASYLWSDVWNAPDHRVVVAAYSGPAVGGTAGACRDYDNVARVDESDTDDFDTSEQTVEVCVDLDDLVVTKTAKPQFARDYDWTIEKSVDQDSQTVEEGAEASFEYDVVVTPSISGDGQFVVTGKITVTNPNQKTISGVQLTDSLPGGQCTIDKPDGTLSIASGESTYDYSCVLPDATATTTGTNTATATWDKAAYYGTSGTASGNAGFDFAKATPTVTDATATVTDTQVDLDGTSPDGVVVKAADGPQTFTYSKEFDGVPGECTTYDNTAKVVATDSKDADSDSETVEVCVDLDDLVVTKTAKPAFARDYDWTIEKSVKGDSSQEVPQGTPASFTYDVVVTPSAAQDTAFVVTGVITVDNPNETTISGVQLADSLPGGQCSIDKPAGTLSIASGESTYDYSCVLPDATATTTGTNAATATWDKTAYVGTSGSASGTAGFDFADAKRTVTDATATVTDSQVQLGDVPGGAVVTASEGPKTFTYTKDFDGVPGACTTYDNTATVVATDSKDVDSDDATVEVCVEKPLQLAPTATADLARDHAWSITKVADATQRTADANGNATFTYTVTARAGARTESGWRLQGEVAITNPNQYADGDIVADVTASTDLGGGAVCTVTGGSDVVVAEDGSTTLPIACAFASAPAGSGTLSVTATWDPAGEATSTSVTESTGPITFAVRSETNKTVQVVDDKTVAGQRVVLDPALTWEAGLVRSYTYSLTLAGGAAGACRSWTNTATIDQPVGTDPTASAAVLVCTPALPPPPVVPPVVAPEVLPEQAFGKAVGSVRASCQGTVRAKLANRTGETVVYKLRVGKLVHKIAVKSLAKKRFVTKGQPRAKVTLKVGSTRLDTLRIPALCAAPEVLPDTGLRATSR